MSESDTAPIMREFGPQNEDHLLDQKNFQQLEKILPVLNGLVYLKKGNLFYLINLTENRDIILKDAN